MSHGDPSYPGNELTPDEWKVLHNKPATKTAINIAKNMTTQMCFNVGETLVCINKRTGKPLHNHGGATMQKFVVVHKDLSGMVYCKRIVSGGRLGKGIEIIATWDYETSEFIQDPEAIDHILLGNEKEYDPYARQRQLTNLRSKVNKSNSTIRLTFPTSQDAQLWMKECKVGDRFWEGTDTTRTHWEVVENTPTTFKVVEVNNTSRTDTLSGWSFTSRYHRYYKDRPRVFGEEALGV